MLGIFISANHWYIWNCIKSIFLQYASYHVITCVFMYITCAWGDFPVGRWRRMWWPDGWVGQARDHCSRVCFNIYKWARTEYFLEASGHFPAMFVATQSGKPTHDPSVTLSVLVTKPSRKYTVSTFIVTIGLDVIALEGAVWLLMLQ